MTDISISERLVDWAVDCPRIDDAKAVAAANDAMGDVISCMIAGAGDSTVQSLIKTTALWGNNGNNLVFGSEQRLQLPWAVLVNGTAAHVLDFDDNFIPAFTHATAVLGPALISLAETGKVSGMDLLDAYIIGLELQAKIGMLVNPDHYQAGWHATATIGTIGTAGACARLLGLDKSSFGAAMSIAFSLASGSKKQFGSMMKPTHAGLAAQHAVMAAKFAEGGILGNPDFLTGPWSFQELYSPGGSKSSEKAINSLGEDFSIVKDGLMVKRFPCCGSAHFTLDGLMLLQKKHNIRPEEIRQVTAYLPEIMNRNLRFNRPENEMEARFSLHYNAARLLLDKHLSLKHFNEIAVKETRIVQFMDRITVEVIPDVDYSNMADVSIRTQIEMENGAIHEIEVNKLKGTNRNPLIEEDIKGKFDDCIQYAGLKAPTSDVYKLIRSIPDLKDINILTSAISKLTATTF